MDILTMIYIIAAQDTPTCNSVLATMTCHRDPSKVSTCSKTSGVGIMMFMHVCVDTATGQEVEVTCHELCCCEQNPSEYMSWILIIHKFVIAYIFT